ncbi:MAG: hypothetical protein HFG41_11220 [Coprococcus sp.]|nr:hypothetical protein [Coprococcus sp.]
MAKTKYAGTTKKVKMVRKPNFLKIILIVAICIILGFYGKFFNFFGRMTGEVADDGRLFAINTVEYKEQSRETELKDGAKVFVPATEKMDFTSEHRYQTITLGNPKENEGYYMACDLVLRDKTLYQSGLLKPGEAVGEADLLAYFKPGDYYEAKIKYIFYEQPETRIKKVGTATGTVVLDVTGSSEYYDERKENEEDTKK